MTGIARKCSSGHDVGGGSPHPLPPHVSPEGGDPCRSEENLLKAVERQLLRNAGDGRPYQLLCDSRRLEREPTQPPPLGRRHLPPRQGPTSSSPPPPQAEMPPFRVSPGTFTFDWLLEGQRERVSPRDLSRSLRNAYGLLLDGGRKQKDRRATKRVKCSGGNGRADRQAPSTPRAVMEEVLARPQACFLTILPHDPPLVVVAHSLGRYYSPSPCGLGDKGMRDNPYRNRIVAFVGERGGATEEVVVGDEEVRDNRGGMGMNHASSYSSLSLPSLFLAPTGKGAVSEELFGAETYRLAAGRIESHLENDGNDDTPDEWLLDPPPLCDEGNDCHSVRAIEMTKLAYIPPHWAVHFLGGKGPFQALKIATRLVADAFSQGRASESEREAAEPLLNWLRLACQADELNPHRSAMSVDWAPVANGSNDPAMRTYALRRMRIAMQATQSAALAGGGASSSSADFHRFGSPPPPIPSRGRSCGEGDHLRQHPRVHGSGGPVLAPPLPTAEATADDPRAVTQQDNQDRNRDYAIGQKDWKCHQLHQVSNGLSPVRSSLFNDDLHPRVKIKDVCSTKGATEVVKREGSAKAQEDDEAVLDYRHHNGGDGVENEQGRCHEKGVKEAETVGNNSTEESPLPPYEEEVLEGGREVGESRQNDHGDDVASLYDDLGREMDSFTWKSGEIVSPSKARDLECHVEGGGNFASDEDCGMLSPSSSKGACAASNAGHDGADIKPSRAGDESSENNFGSGGKEPMGCLGMKGLPFSATKQDVMNFFGQFQPLEESVTLAYLSDGRAAGTAQVKFPSRALARAALMSMDMKKIEHRFITLRDLSPELDKMADKYDPEKLLSACSASNSAVGETVTNSEPYVAFMNVSHLPTQAVFDKMFGIAGSRHRQLMSETSCKIYVRGRGRRCKHYPFREGEDSTQLEVIIQGRWANLVSKAKRRVLEILDELPSSTSSRAAASHSEGWRNHEMHMQHNSWLVTAGQKRKYEHHDNCDGQGYDGGGRYSNSYDARGYYASTGEEGYPYYQGSAWNGGHKNIGRVDTYSSWSSVRKQYANGRSYRCYSEEY